MRVLAIDTSLEACSAAVLDTERLNDALHESKPMTRGHAEALMPIVARVLDRSGLETQQVDRIAVTTGPGSFTGLRVGIAAARGLALASGKPAIGLTTLAAFAAPLIAADDSAPVVSVIDARHENVYVQVFGPGGLTLVKPQLMNLRDAVRASLGGPPHLAGNAAKLLAHAWPADQKPPRSIAPGPAPDIAWVARLGAAAPLSTSPPKPFYLRPPDAQPQAAAQLARR